MTEETTSEQLAEIDRDMAEIERQVAELVEEAQRADYKTQELPEYTPPDGWRVVRFGELLLPGDEWVNWEGTVSRPDILHGDGTTASGGRYIRWVKPQPQPDPQPHPQPEPVPQAELDAELQIRLLKEANDSQAETIGRLLTEARDLNMEIGGLERRLSERDARIRDLETMHAAATKSFEDANKANDALRAQVRILQQEANKKTSRIEFSETLNAGNGAAIRYYKAKVEKLQGLVDTARGQLETAATEHDNLSTQLAAVKAELVTQAETSRRLQIELDAAQQVPADSPEIRQLRADLEQATLGRDTYRDGYDRVLSDLVTARKTAKAEAIEAIAEWLEPIRLADSAYLANATMRHLPSIMRHLTGLADEEIE